MNYLHMWVSGCHDSGAHLYRWSEMTDSASEQYQKERLCHCPHGKYVTILSAASTDFHIRESQAFFYMNKRLTCCGLRHNSQVQKHLRSLDVFLPALSRFPMMHVPVPGGLFHVEVEMRLHRTTWRVNTSKLLVQNVTVDGSYPSSKNFTYIGELQLQFCALCFWSKWMTKCSWTFYCSVFQ